MSTQRGRDDGAFERLRRLQAEIERQIAEAAERGDLAGLAGEGRPLPRDPDDGAGERWAAAHVLRNAEAAPEWIDLRKRIFAERDALARRVRAHQEWHDARRKALERLHAEALLPYMRETERGDDRFHAELADAVDELNRRIARHNLLVRVHALQLAPTTVAGVEALVAAAAER
jgi:hypothetical protein